MGGGKNGSGGGGSAKSGGSSGNSGGGAGKSSGSETMNAPGQPGRQISRDDFEKDPAGYFQDLHKKDPAGSAGYLQDVHKK